MSSLYDRFRAGLERIAAEEEEARHKRRKAKRRAASKKKNLQFDMDLGIVPGRSNKLAIAEAQAKAARKVAHSRRRKGDTTGCPAEAYRVKSFCRKRRS